MDVVYILFRTIGGLGLFLYGMHKMSDGLKRAASNKIRSALSHLTKNRVAALLIGAAVTAVIQSSSASTVMTVGLVNAGLLTFKQAISVILGANIGTTFTAWLVSAIGKFSIAVYALPAIGIGFFLRTFGRRNKFIELGEILLGFGLIFFGLDIMKDAFAPVKESEQVVEWFVYFSKNPVLGVLVGAFFTMLLQSSSATIAIIQILAFNGVIGLDSAIPLILGDNIGTTITAELSSIGTNLNAKRTARAHSLFNVIGVCIILPIVWLGLYGEFIQFIFPGEITKTNIMAHIAISHTVFNILNASIFIIFINLLIKATDLFVREKKGADEMTPKYLQEKFLENPAIAMEHVIKEIIRMAELAKKTVVNAQEGFYKSNESMLKKANDGEGALDDFQRMLTECLIKISERHLYTRESTEYPILLHSINDLEKIGDHASNIVSFGTIRIKRRFTFNENDLENISQMFDTLYEMFDIVIESLKTRNSEIAKKAIFLEDKLDIMKSDCRISYIERLKQGDINPEAEVLKMDIATNIEKMGDHLISIAKAVIKDLRWGSHIDTA